MLKCPTNCPKKCTMHDRTEREIRELCDAKGEGEARARARARHGMACGCGCDKQDGDQSN